MKNIAIGNHGVGCKNFRARVSLLAMICFGIFAPAAVAAGAPARIVTFDPPGAVHVWAWGIDSAGLIAGTYYDSSTIYHGYTMDAAGNITTFDAPGAGTGFDEGTYTAGISENGQICGAYSGTDGREHGFLLSEPAGTFTTFDISNSDSTAGSSVNDSGQVAGNYSANAFPGGPFGLIWTLNGTVTTFEPTNVETVNNAKINSSGEVAGAYNIELKVLKTRGYFRDVSGNITSFDASPSAQYTWPLAINDGGSVAGYFTDAHGANHGFLRAGKSITQIDIPGAAATYIWAINASGTVAGYYSDASNVYHGFTRDKLGNVTVIDVSYAGTAGNQGTFATAISASGEVAGYFIGSLGNWHGFLRR